MDEIGTPRSGGGRNRWLLPLALAAAWSSNFAPLALAQQPAAGQASATPANRRSFIDPKAQQLIDKVIQALGGRAFLSFKAATSRGRVFSISDGVTEGLVTFESEVKFPDKRRFAYGFGKSKPIVLINNGERAWEIDRMGVTDQLPEQVAAWKLANRYSLENLLRVRLQGPGILVQMGGSDFVQLVPATTLDIIDSTGAHLKLYLDQRNNLPVEISYRIRDPETGKWKQYADTYADYQTFQGIATAMHIVRFVDGERAAEVFRNSVRYNDTYPAGYFAPPGAQSP